MINSRMIHNLGQFNNLVKTFAFMLDADGIDVITKSNQNIISTSKDRL